MSHFFLAGRADDPAYAEAERLCDILLSYLPDCTVVKARKHPDQWPAFAKRLEEVVGIVHVSSPLIWTGSGRVIGGLAALSTYVFRHYGIVCDLSHKQLAAHAAVNLAEASVDLLRSQISSQQTGKRALVVVDLQNDFCRGGALPVPCANEVIPVVNDLIRRCAWDLLVFTQDFHPKGHSSFASTYPSSAPFTTRMLPGTGEQVLWPDHCVASTVGAELHPYLLVRPNAGVGTTALTGDGSHSCPAVTVQKGTHKRADSYSGFGDAHGRIYENTHLDQLLQDFGIQDVYVCGVALDFCAGFTALDAAACGLTVFIVADACRSIQQEAGAAMLQRLAREGVVQVTCHTVPLKSCSGRVHSGILGSEGVDEAPMDFEAEADSHSEQADTEADADLDAAVDTMPASV